MSRPKPLDVADPVRSLLAASGLTQVELAERAARGQSTIAGAVKRGGGVGLDVLVRLCEAAGGELVISYRPGAS